MILNLQTVAITLNTPLVSILIRSTDRETLQQTLSSVGAQTYSAIEVWVVAATPAHVALPAQIGNFPLNLVNTQAPLSRTQAANKALQLARGDWILFLDDDDWILPDHVAGLAQVLQGHPNYKAAYCQAQTVNLAGQDLSLPLIGMPYNKSMLLSGNFMVMHSVLFDASLRQKGCQFDEQLDLFEDWDFWLQVSRHTDFLFVPRATAVYRIHTSSGVHEQQRFVDANYQHVYRKWRQLWSMEELSQIMARNWEHTENVAALLHTQCELTATQNAFTANQASLSQTQASLNEVQITLSKTQHELGDSQQANLHLQMSLDAMMRSRSWRWTQKLRTFGSLARRVRQLVRQQGGVSHALKKTASVLLHQGPKSVMSAVQRTAAQQLSYADWIAQNEASPAIYPRLKEKCLTWQHQPMVSVVMPTYNSPLNFLAQAIESVQAQIYPHWQLCIADDASPNSEVQEFLKHAALNDSRISIVLRTTNGHISESSNSALGVAKGEWVALLDHDDLLHPLALYELVNTLQSHPDAQIIFSDEDKIDEEGHRFGPYFKTEYNPELMWAQNMISHLGCYRRSTLETIGGFRKGYEGSQDYDLALRVIQLAETHQIVHIPRVLYHWRAIAGSTALAPNEKPYAEIASRKALAEHLNAIHLPASVEPAPELTYMNRVRPSLQRPDALISLIIPTKDGIELLKQCLQSVQQKSSYKSYEILVVNNNSQLPESFVYFDQLKREGIRVLDYPDPFNFSAINNFAAREARGEYLCLMNNDIEVQSSDWMEEMLSFAQLNHVGAVGARLWYPHNQGIQHAGVVVGLGGVAGHANVGLQKNGKGYFGRPVLHHRCSAVTAACLMIKKATYFAIDGMDEKIAVAFNDVDFCLRLGAAGYHCVYTPSAELTHHESATRGDDLSEANRQRFMSEELFMKARWGEQLQHDPFFSPNLSLDYTDFRMAPISRVVRYAAD
jgi:glycosyltransferase involved in cell wall biosynthesis